MSLKVDRPSRSLERFPWGSAIFASVAGLASFLVAAVAIWPMANTSDVLPDLSRVEMLVLVGFAAVTGAYGLSCIWRLRKRLVMWRDSR